MGSSLCTNTDFLANLQIMSVDEIKEPSPIMFTGARSIRKLDKSIFPKTFSTWYSIIDSEYTCKIGLKIVIQDVLTKSLAGVVPSS
ncbi:hypothetical protein AVEN_50012-1 [Araneus ventricosus]|uniref:Uncharacterized protein n=1 Tax=Araneus ventricosus TaxID=182803 RepID=A0A4Y2D2F1_ARAVE|nr:hypothetical protein AVEN_50012-1 [Araneus ventricosus]